MRIHLVGVCGTGMASLASLFREAGHTVSGSDARFDPPMGDVLRGAGVVCFEGYAEANLAPELDLVVVGNAIRKDNAEAVAAERRGLTRLSMSGALRAHFLEKRKPLVVSGTHGKTTTSAMCAWILNRAELEPGYFIGGVTKNFPRSASIGRARAKLASSLAPRLSPPAGAGMSRAPFVIEGDEYDAVYWHKEPKFLDYIGVGDDDVAIITSVEHDHIDIYPDAASYEAVFRSLVARIPPGGLLVASAHEPRTVAIARASRSRVALYTLEGDPVSVGESAAQAGQPVDAPTWHGALVSIDESGAQPFDLFAGGVSCGRFSMRMPGAHNVRNAIAAIAACAEGFGVPVSTARAALATFEGVKRRQDLLGEPGGVRVYDDFAHHPTAVAETLRALRARHASGALWAIFEPRSATACRSIHQDAYAGAFAAADKVLLAPLGRSNVPDAERLDVARLAAELGPKAEAAASVDVIVERVARGARAGDTVAVLSNGAFGGIHARLLVALAKGA